jgi:hypothetical protein
LKLVEGREPDEPLLLGNRGERWRHQILNSFQSKKENTLRTFDLVGEGWNRSQPTDEEYKLKGVNNVLHNHVPKANIDLEVYLRGFQFRHQLNTDSAILLFLSNFRNLDASRIEFQAIGFDLLLANLSH